MRLESIYGHAGEYNGALWELLKTRTKDESISHRQMPTWDEHCRFVGSRPYLAWYVVVEDGEMMPLIGHVIGTCYITKQRELGITIHPFARKKGYARAALTELMARHPGDRFLANINPANQASIALFLKLGFDGPIQITMEKR